MRFIEFIQPGETTDPTVTRVTPREAIAQFHRLHPHARLSDDECLDHFITTHLAWWVEDPRWRDTKFGVVAKGTNDAEESSEA